KAAGQNKWLMKLVDERGLADAGVSGNQHQLRPAAGDDTVEGGKQDTDLGRPPIQLFGDHQPIRSVVFSGGEFVDTASGFPFGKAPPQIALGARSRLVTLLGSLGEQLHDDRRDRAREVSSLAGWRRWSCNMTVPPFHWIARREGQNAHEHLVQRDAE